MTFKDGLKLSQVTSKLLANFTYLSLLEVIGLLLPLISYPYLIRTVGANYYGIVVFAQAIIAYIIIVVNFGFNVSATRRVSESRDNLLKIKQIYSSVVYSKLMLFLITAVVALLFLKLIDYDHIDVVCFFFGLCVQEVLFPTWLYQGLEEMKFITIITFISKCSYLLLIFIFIHKAEDFVIIPILYSFGGILTSLVSIYILKKRFNIHFVKVEFSQLKSDFIESIPFFSSRISSVVMERTNVIAIGAYFSYEMVAIYDLCTKIVSIVKTPFSLVAQVIYPNVARSKDMIMVRKIVKPVFYSGVFFSLIIVFLSKTIVHMLGGIQMYEAVSILRLMIWYVPIVGLSYLFGASVLVVNGYSKEYNLSVIYSVLFYLLLMSLFSLTKKINLYTMTFTFLLPEMFVAFYRIYVTQKYRLLK